jgi:putative transcription antitermination factor YqgF
MTVLGLDYGRVHIGLAIGHTETSLSLPLRTFSGLPRHALLEEIREIVHSHSIDQLVVGLPVTLQGEVAGKLVDEAKDFGQQLASFANKPVDFMDERFTSAVARRLQHNFPQADEHSVAAMCLLQTYLDLKASALP